MMSSEEIPTFEVVGPRPATRRPSKAVWRAHHRRYLLLSIGVVIASFVFAIGPAGTVAIGSPNGWTLPPTCATRAWFDLPCPGCGLTRSFVLLADGKFAESFRMHRLGWLLATLIVLQIPYRLWLLYGNRSGSVTGPKWPQYILWGVVVLLIVNWLDLLIVRT